ncbi:hypothetical protein F4677DRAFT_462990 [Hypoxylon crocopeplum]|nr:hypothetical protein F4677DRAFT_462990 [Hypoxylon crocopeplum]
MASFGKIQNSVASFSNENTAALINVNIDFSLFRCQPLAEFLAVGSALSVQRKEEAESGQTHKTACTLGFLFHEKLPDTSSLFKAYGLRASEIISRSDINPQGTTGDGPFKDYIGANGTSIWAAATSGEASIAVHLLACMLARAFDAKSATSIWVEIVRERRLEIEDLVRNNKVIHPNSYVASKQDITRAELAAWDVCGRAWLRRADEFKAKERRQFALIVENINVPYTAPGSTYSKVLTTWTNSMRVLDNLLNNISQEASDRAILLAISSWHLFPNLLIFQNQATKVDCHDLLFPASGILTLGLEFKSHKLEEPIRWSLALSHLRYYGDPVRVRSNEDISRVTMPQLWLVALGSILRSWGTTNSEIPQVICWFRDLGDLLASTPGGDCPELSWIVAFSEAARYYLALENGEEVHGLSLVKYGWRRATQFFGQNLRCYPFFMLRENDIIRGLKEEDDISKGFAYISNVVARSAIGSKRVFISFSMTFGAESYSEWMIIDPPGAYPPTKHQTQPEASSATTKKRRWIFFYNNRIGATMHPELLQKRKKYIESLGEVCDIIYNNHEMPDDESRNRRDTLYWHNPPEALSNGSQNCLYLRKIHVSQNTMMAAGFYLWVVTDAEDPEILDIDSRENERAAIDMCRLQLKDPSLAKSIVGFLKSFTTSHKVTLPIRVSTEHDEASESDQSDHPPSDVFANTGSSFSLMIKDDRPPVEWVRSVRALEAASILYHELPGATISLKIIEVELHKARWFPDISRPEAYVHSSLSDIAKKSAREWFNTMTRENAFGCIAMFESGHMNINSEHLEETVALCTENSIFVAGILLSDPTDVSDGPRIRHLVGSIGQTGMVLLVAPLQPRIKPMSYDPMAVDHKIFAGELEMPLDWENTGEIDQDIFLLESVISVQHNGQWIADIDVLGLEKTPPDLFYSDCGSDCNTPKSLDLGEVVRIDTWEELLDPPPTTGVLRAKGNWIARLAATSILIQQEKGNAIVLVAGKDHICWNCFAKRYSFPEPHIPQFIID